MIFSKKMSIYYTGITLVCAYLFIFYIILIMLTSESHHHRSSNKDQMFLRKYLPSVVVHLDLKGAPPKLGYLINSLAQLKPYGVSGLLIEYEDMFPYTGRLANLSSTHAYTKDDLVKFLQKVSVLGFEVIPLIQTFGHLEYALKLPEFQDLRENPLFPDSICPSNPLTTAFIEEMIDQVIQLHNSIKPLKYFHIGADEVYHLKECHLCKNSDDSKTKIYLRHIIETTKIVKKIAPETRVLFWHDVLQQKDLISTKIYTNLNAEPVHWQYSTQVDVKSTNFYRYPYNMNSVWVASAFKGADGEFSLAPNIKKRLQNTFTWLRTVLEYSKLNNYYYLKQREIFFNGIILTGWSRYSHMAPMCDLLPASLPSLIANLLVIREFSYGVTWLELEDGFEDFYNNRLKRRFSSAFKCDLLNKEDEHYCTFTEYPILQLLNEYITLKKEIELFYNYEYYVEYYMKLGIIGKSDAIFRYSTCIDYQNQILSWESSFSTKMKDYYDNATIVEYTNSLTYHFKSKLVNTEKVLKNYRNITVWSRRANELAKQFELETTKQK